MAFATFGRTRRTRKEGATLLALLLLLLLVAVFFGLGFVVKWLFIIAAVLAIVWIVGFFARGASTRWYRW